MRAVLAGREGGPVHVLAVGKAASAMTLGAADALGPALARALVVSRSGHFDPELERHGAITCLAGGHPLPDMGSLAAGAAMLDFAASTPAGARVLLLVSGGASSLAEVLAPGVGLTELRAVNDWALGAGVEIEQLNRVRRGLSRLKDGRLVTAFAHCRIEGYFISDVPGDDPAVVGSGLLAPEGDARRLDDAWPAWIVDLVTRSTLPPGQGPARVECVGRLDDALAAIERAAVAMGLSVGRRGARLAGDAVDAALRFCHELELGSVDLLLAGGETTVVLPARPGRGGRNLHLALAAACQLAGHGHLLVLAAGSDGSDGNSDDAGALVDGSSIERGREAGLEPGDCLARADSGVFLEATGDLVHTGPTGTNVGDLLMGLRRDPVHSRGGATSM